MSGYLIIDIMLIITGLIYLGMTVAIVYHAVEIVRDLRGRFKKEPPAARSGG